VQKTLEVIKDGEDMVASTPSLDRDHDHLLTGCFDVTNFNKNPVLIYGHNYREPWAVIGKCADLRTDEQGRLRFKPDLRDAANEADPMNIIRLLWEQDLLRAASVGFISLESQPNDQGGRDYKRVDLLEISLVPVPANQEALRLAMKALDLDFEHGDGALDLAVKLVNLERSASIEAEPAADEPVENAAEQGYNEAGEPQGQGTAAKAEEANTADTLNNVTDTAEAQKLLAAAIDQLDAEMRKTLLKRKV
jgi:HK97 family phage prohead protease